MMNANKYAGVKQQPFREQDLIIQGLSQCSQDNSIQFGEFEENSEMQLLQFKINKFQKSIQKDENEVYKQKQQTQIHQSNKYSIAGQNRQMQTKIQHINSEINQITEQYQSLRQNMQPYLINNRKPHQLSKQKNLKSQNKKRQKYNASQASNQENKLKQENKQHMKLQNTNNNQIGQFIHNYLDMKQLDGNALHSKQTIIRKLININSESSIKQLARKDQIIKDLQKKVSQYFQLLGQQKTFSGNLQNKLNQYEANETMNEQKLNFKDSLFSSLVKSIQIANQRKIFESNEKKQKIQQGNQRLQKTNSTLQSQLQQVNKNKKIQNQPNFLRQQNQIMKINQETLFSSKLSEFEPIENNFSSTTIKDTFNTINAMKDQLQRLKFTNELLEIQKVEKDVKIKKLEKQVQQKATALILIEDKLKKVELKHYEINKEKTVTLLNQKKRNKNEETNTNEEQLLNQIQQLKRIIDRLQRQIKEVKENNEKEIQKKGEQFAMLLHEIITINKQKQTMKKVHQEDLFEQKQKLMQYATEQEQNRKLLMKKIEILEQKNSQLTQKLDEYKYYQEQLANIKKENRQFKNQTTQALNFAKQTFKNYKKLQQKFKSATTQQQHIREKYESLQKKYCGLCQQKSKYITKLDNCYGQIQQLNMALINKQRQYIRNNTESRLYVASPSNHKLSMSPHQEQYSPRKKHRNQNIYSQLNIQKNIYAHQRTKSYLSPQKLQLHKNLKSQITSTLVLKEPYTKY